MAVGVVGPAWRLAADRLHIVAGGGQVLADELMAMSATTTDTGHTRYEGTDAHATPQAQQVAAGVPVRARGFVEMAQSGLNAAA